MGKTLLMLHGRDFKPPQASLKKLWLDALRFGIERDHPAGKVRAFDRAHKELIYYGHESNRFLSQLRGVSVPDDTASRRQTLEELKKYRADEFSKKSYNRLPGKTSYKEALADVFGPVLSFFHLTDDLVARVAPDMRQYWNLDSPFGSRVRQPMILPLKQAMGRGDDLLVIAHSLGSLIAYDTFWKFSHTGEYRDRYGDKKISLWITIGSPLADETVKRKLKGAQASGHRRYPGNVERWVNLAAQDDYISHDQRVRNDYREMERLGLVTSPIEDHRIYNLAVRNRRSNPHHSGGYLIHPKMAALVVAWL